ncbi:3059_t:CDS:2, partial [Paraglomus brasilianum]
KLDYSALRICTDSALWNLLYYSGYLTMDQNNELSIPNKEVLSEWYDWLQLEGKISTTWLFDLLMRGDLTKFNRDLSETIMNTLLYHDVANAKEAVYHLFLAGLFAQAQFSGYEVKSNRESGLGRVDIRIEPKKRLVECGIAFWGKECIVVGRVSEKKSEHWELVYQSEML